MSYTNTVTIINLEGGDYPSATTKLWMLWTVIDTGAGSAGVGPQQQEQGTFTVQTDSSFTFAVSFVNGPDNHYSSRSIGLSIQDTNRINNNTGWWFRSGQLDTLPTSPIEVVLVNSVDFTQAEVNAALPTFPMTVDPTTTLTSGMATLQDDGFISLVAMGTTTHSPLTAPVGFTYTLLFKIAPSAAIADAEQEVFDIETQPGQGPGQGRGTIVFAGGGVAAIEAALLNIIGSFVVQKFFPQIHGRLKDGLNTAVLSQIAGRIAPGATTLPAGVIVSARSVNTNSSKITVRAALGAFGGVLSKFPGINPGGGTGKCALNTLAALALPAIQLNLFRMFRDHTLAQTPTGQKLISLYYRHSAEVARIFLQHLGLARQSAQLLLELQDHLLNQTPVELEFANRCESLASKIADYGSSELQADIKWASSVGESRKMFEFNGLGTFASTKNTA